MRRILDGVLAGRELSVDDALVLCTASGPELHVLLQTADELRRQQVGDEVSYVINRNINFTNVCVKACRFCASHQRVIPRAKTSIAPMTLCAIGTAVAPEEVVKRMPRARRRAKIGSSMPALGKCIQPRFGARRAAPKKARVSRASAQSSIIRWSARGV